MKTHFLYRFWELGRRRSQSLLCLLCLLITSPVFAQMDQGAISGTVTDATGAVLPAAQVTVTSTDTSLVLRGQTDANGVYVFSPIKIGNYKLSVSAPGFSNTTQENIAVRIQERVEVNIPLKPGSESNTVTVTEAPPLLQTEEGSTGQVTEARTVDETPLNGRNWIFIAQLTAGVPR